MELQHCYLTGCVFLDGLWRRSSLNPESWCVCKIDDMVRMPLANQDPSPIELDCHRIILLIASCISADRSIIPCSSPSPSAMCLHDTVHALTRHLNTNSRFWSPCPWRPKTHNAAIEKSTCSPPPPRYYMQLPLFGVNLFANTTKPVVSTSQYFSYSHTCTPTRAGNISLAIKTVLKYFALG